jgi:MFS family permease
LTICATGFLFGYDSGIITSTIGQPTLVEYFGTPDAATTGGIVAVSAGAVLGSLSAAWLGDILGRKKTIFVGGCISTLGCSFQTGAATVGMLIAGCILKGVAAGILTAAVPMYCVSNPSNDIGVIVQY